MTGQSLRLARLLAPLATQAIDQMLRERPGVSRGALEEHVAEVLHRGIEKYRERRAAEAAREGE